MASEKYKYYLKSEKWAEIRRSVWRRDNGKCRDCGGKGRDVHHITYQHLYFEDEHLEDLVLLCADCHHIRHYGPFPTLAELERRITDLIKMPPAEEIKKMNVQTFKID